MSYTPAYLKDDVELVDGQLVSEAVTKEFSAPSSATSGIAGYSLEGQKKKKRRGPRYMRKAEFDESAHPRDDHGRFGTGAADGPGTQQLHADAAAIAAMSEDVRDNTRIGDFPGGGDAYSLYEAQKLLPNDSDKLKRVTENNTFNLWNSQHYIARTGGRYFGVTKQEDSDAAEDDEHTFVYAYERIDVGFRERIGMIVTHTSDKDELFRIMRADPDERRTAKPSKVDLGLLVKRCKPRRTVSSRVSATLKAHEGRVARKLAAGLRRQGARLAQELRARVPLPEGASRLARLLGRALLKAQTPTQEELDRILDNIDLEGFAVSVMDDVMPELEAAFKEAGLEAVTAAGIDATEEIVTHMDERALEFAQDRGAEMVGKKWVDGELIDNPEAEWSIEETTRDALRLLTGDAVEEGMSSQEFADAIEESGEFSEERAMMIARTELATAHVQGNLEGWRESGVVSMKQWIVADADVCDICDPMDEEEVPLDEAFSSGDDGPPLHPNCRCDVVGVVEGDEAATAEDSGDTEE